MRRAARVLSLLLPLWWLSPNVAAQPASPSAGDKDTARRLMDEGDTHYEANRFEEALKAYRAADDIMGVPTTTFEVGKAYEALGKLVEARDAYLRAVRYPRQGEESSAFVEARDRANERARALSGRIATLTVRVDGAPEDVALEISIDKKAVKGGSGVPRSVNPGARNIEVRAAGYKPAATTITLTEGEKREVTLKIVRDPNAREQTVLPPPQPPPDKPPEQGGGFPIAATLGFGFAAAGIIVGSITGGLSLAKASDLEDVCTDKICPPDQQDNLDQAELLANVSNVSFAVAGAGIIFGVIALFTIDAPKQEALLVTPHSVGVRF